MAGAASFAEAFDAVNVHARWPGRQGKGSRFPRPGRRRLARVAAMCTGRVVLLAGKRVAGAMGARAGYLEWFDMGGARAAVLPHPSGVNRWWNSAENRARATEFVRECLRTTSTTGTA